MIGKKLGRDGISVPSVTPTHASHIRLGLPREDR
jgi:hypothetical protein